jgi:hypothetical protein
MKTLIYVRSIEHPTETANDFDTKRELVNQIESYGFVCCFAPGSIAVYATRHDSLWTSIKEALLYR